MRSILIGVDDSEYGQAATDLALDWGMTFPYLLVGLGIVDVPGLASPEPVPLGAASFKVTRDVQAVAAAHRRIESLLQQFSLRCSEAHIPSKILENEGSPLEQLIWESHRFGLIMLGQKTDFDLDGHPETSEVLPELLKRAPRPVVIVPRKLPAAAAAVVAYDGSLQAARALQLFQLSGLAETRAVHVVSVAPDRVKAAMLADRAAEFLRSHVVEATPHAIESSSPAETLLDCVQALNGGLLVMGAFGQPRLREFFFGSVTRTILAQSPVPTFLYA